MFRRPRRVLATVVLAGAVALAAGCSSEGDATPPEPPDTPSPAGQETTTDSGPVSSLESVGEVDRSDVEVRVAELLSDLEAVDESEGAVVEIPDTVLFDFDSAELKSVSSEVLDDLVEVLVLLEDAPATVRGHTDDVGASAYNQRLSEDRAAAVVDYLVEAGVDPSLLTSEGLGESEPVADNDSDQGRARNRRVEVVLPSIDLDELPDPEP